MKRTFRHIYGLLMTMVAGCLLASCSEEVYDSIGSQGESTTLRISYNTSLPQDIKVTTRSAASDEENALNNLQIFMFGEDGKLCGYKYIGDKSLLKQDGSIGSVDVKVKTGKARIYAVANVPTSIYSVGEYNSTTIPTSESEAWDETKAKNGEINFTLDEFKTLPFERQAREIRITEANFLMCGVANDGELCEIGTNSSGWATITNPTSGSDAALIKLRRIVSKVKFMVKAASGITFNPTKYEIFNIPLKGPLVEGSTSVSLSTANDVDTYTNIFNKQDEEDGYNTFTLYLPENIQTTSGTVSSWLDREKDNGNTTGTREFTNAPTYATYIELFGEYTKGNVKADAKYFIHLGDFGSDITDFKVERNCTYTYQATITGVDRLTITAEKFTDTDGSNEGIVLDFTDGDIYTLDSHYEKVDMEFNKDDDIKTLTLEGKEYQGIYFMANDIRGYSGICIVYKDGNEIKVKKGNEDCFDSNDDLTIADWAEFLDGSDKNYPGTTSSSLKSIVQVLKELVNNVDNNSFWTKSGSNYTKTYTCFIKENYYEDKIWSDFANKDDRYLYIARDLQNSTDYRTINGDVIYGVKQRSIQTFYNKEKAGTIVAYGCETNPDDNYGGRSSNNSSSTKYSISAHGQGVGSSNWDGRTNMISDLDESGWNVRLWYTNSGSNKAIANNSNYTRARYVCMSRNRDLNGDGKISDDEVRWYCPTLRQYAGLLVGEDAIASEARQFTNKTSTLGEGSNWKSRKNGIHYYYNENRSDNIIWGEEGLSTSAEVGNETNGITSSEQTKLYVRCIRTLQSNGTGTSVSPDEYFEVSNNVVDLAEIDHSTLRTSYQETELLPHNESSVINDPAQKFEVATSVVTENGSTKYTTMESAVSDATTICSNYHKTSGDKWRAPNQKELTLMFAFGLTNNERECCRTKFSSPSFRYSWECHESQMQMRNPYSSSNPNQDDSNDEIYTLRCVRDVK